MSLGVRSGVRKGCAPLSGGQYRAQALLDPCPRHRKETAGQLRNLGQGHAKFCSKEPDRLSNEWLADDDQTARAPETALISEEEFARQIRMINLTVTSGGSFIACFDCNEMFSDHVVGIYSSLKKGVKNANTNIIPTGKHKERSKIYESI